jgi:hypothetical protein
MISPSDLTFTTSASELGLPSFLSCSSQASLLGTNNVWDKFTILAGADASSSFALYLASPYTKIMSATGYIVCSNMWGVLDSFVMNDITISNFFTFTLTVVTTSNSCSPLSKYPGSVTYKVPFSFQNTPTSTLSFSSFGNVYSGYCGMSGPKCDNPFEGCFYDYWCSYNPDNGPCPYDQLLLSSLVLSGSVTVTTTLYISAMMSFQTQSVNGTYTISNIEIIDVQDAQIMSTNVTYHFSDSSYLSNILNMLGGVSSIEDNINKLVLTQLNNFTPKIISAINQELATLTFAL